MTCKRPGIKPGQLKTGSEGGGLTDFHLRKSIARSRQKSIEIYTRKFLLIGTHTLSGYSELDPG
jgi:hypothetical protein